MIQDTQALHTPSIGFLLSHGRRKLISGAMAHAHPYIPSQSHPYIFPLYNPASVDFIIFWEIPSQQRSGHLLVSGLTLGARHGALGQIIEEAEGTKIKRSMYAETQREKEGILDAIRGSEWNAEMNPLVLVAQEPPTLTHNFEKGFVFRQAKEIPWLISLFFQTMSDSCHFDTAQLLFDT